MIPTYNAARVLPICLEALQKQTCPPNEIIVVDDGSEDDTRTVAKRYGVLLLEQVHTGAPAARNLGLEHAQADIILFTDSDCEPVPNWIAEMVQPFDDPEVAGVKGTYGTRQRQVIARLAQCEFEERYDRLEQSPTIDFVDSYAAAFRSTALRQIGGFFTKFLGDEDGELSYRLVTAGLKLSFNRRAMVYHRHSVTWGDYFRRKLWRGYWRTVVFRYYPRKALNDSYTPQFLKIQILLIYLGILAAFLALVNPSGGWAMETWVIAFIFSAAPFMVKVAQVDRSLIAWSLPFIFIRAVAFGLGVAGAAIGVLIYRHPDDFIRRFGDLMLWQIKKD